MFLLDAPKAEAPVKIDELRIDQKDFTFAPRIVTVRNGQAVKLTNSDSANHNARGASLSPKNQFNVYTGTGGESIQRFVGDPKNRPIRLGCDIHTWMTGWVYVFDRVSSRWHDIAQSLSRLQARSVSLFACRSPDPCGLDDPRFHRPGHKSPDYGFDVGNARS